jgi:hypothetical protein
LIRSRLLAAHHTTSHHFVPSLFLSSVSSSVSSVDSVFGCCEFDTHAHTCALGSNFVPLSYTGRVCDVSPYNADQGKCERNIPIISGATAYTCQNSGQTFILVINEGLWLGHKLRHSLLNQNQIQYNGISVWDNPFNHSNPLSIEHPDVLIPLLTSGTNIFIDTRTPTQHELDSCPHIHLTCDSKWNPQTVNLASIRSVEAEDSTTGDGRNNGIEPGLSQISCVYSYTAMVESLQEIYDPNGERSISATMTDVPGQRTFISKDRHSAVTPEQLSK